MSIIAGKIFSFLVLILLSVMTVVMIRRMQKSDEPVDIRRLAGLDALEEVVGRATETGRPIHYNPGIGSIESASTGARVLGGMEVLGWLSYQCARYDTRLISTYSSPSSYAIAREVVRNGYVQAGKPENFKEETAQFLSNNQMAFAMGAISIMQRENIASNVLIGSYGAECLLLAEAGNTLGAIQISGDTNAYQLPFLIVTCDYSLIAEELFAAGAVLSNNRDVYGSLIAQDYGKIIAVALLVVGTVLVTFGNQALIQLLSW
jgi:hypothetical protein